MDWETTLLNCQVDGVEGKKGGGADVPLCPCACGTGLCVVQLTLVSVDRFGSLPWGLHTRHATSCILCCNDTGSALVTHCQTADIPSPLSTYLHLLMNCAGTAPSPISVSGCSSSGQR